MNHSIDTGSETDVRVHPELCRRANSKQSKLLETLIDNIIESLQDKSCKPKVRDALLAIKLQQQVTKTSEAEGIFWDMIDDIRNSEMSEPISLEAQILRTISSLEHEVRNGILPVKMITDAFNQDRSEQTRLTSQRMSGLLSTMGFTKVRAANGARAIIWDDHRIFASPDKVASCICPQEQRGHRELGTDSATPLCVSPLIRGEITGNPPDHEGTHSEDRQGAVLSPPNKGGSGGYDKNAPSAEEAKDHRVTIPGPGVCPSASQSLALSPSDVEDPQDRRSGGKEILPIGSFQTGHGNLKADSETPLCISPLIRGKGREVPLTSKNRRKRNLGGSCFATASPPRPGVKS